MVAPVLASDGVKLNIKNGDTLSSPIHLEFNVSGLSVKPAGAFLRTKHVTRSGPSHMVTCMHA